MLIVMAKSTDSTYSLLDKIFYLAELTSDRRAIDPILDTVRGLTAQQNFDINALTKSDQQALQKVEAKLQDYLIHHDPLRVFSPETLEQQIYEHFEGRRRFHTLRLMMSGIFLAAIVAGGLFFMVATPLFQVDPSMQIPITILAGYAILQIGAILLFLQALKHFNPKLKRAYLFICVGFGILALTQLHLPFLYLIEYSLWAQMSGYTILFAVAALAIYIGLRIYAGTLSLKSLPWSRVALLVLIVSLASILTPHAAASVPLAEPFFDISIGSLAIVILFAALSLGVGRSIIQVTSALYARAMRRFITAVGIMGLAMTLFLVFRIGWADLGRVPFKPALILAMLLLVGSSLMYVYSAYVFNKLTRY